MKKYLALVACTAVFGLADSLPTNNVYLGIGTTGPVVGYRYIVNDNLALRADLAGFSISKDFDSDDVKYDANIKMMNAGVYADYFPFDNGFYISGGALFGKNKINLTAKPNALHTIEMNGKSYLFGKNDFIETSLTTPNVRPYLGIGYAKTKSKGFGFSTNFGVAYGKFKVDAKASDSLNAMPGFKEDFDREVQDIRNDFNKVKVYPVVNIGVSYSF